MLETYKQWIVDNVGKDAYGSCREYSVLMKAAFPELELVRGYYYCWVWGQRSHWWLRTADGEIVDPTADQFPTKGVAKYEELDPTAPEPIGMCPNCGDLFYDDAGGGYVCSQKCAVAYVAYVNNPY